MRQTPRTGSFNFERTLPSHSRVGEREQPVHESPSVAVSDSPRQNAIMSARSANQSPGEAGLKGARAPGDAGLKGAKASGEAGPKRAGPPDPALQSDRSDGLDPTPPVSTEWGPPSHLYGKILIAAFAPFAALIVLFAFNVPIGQPFFLIYRYSPFVELRILHAIPAILIGMTTVVLLWVAMRRVDNTPRWAIWAAAAGYTLLVGWTFVAPPDFVAQHSFNLHSPSHDGAFVVEGRAVESVPVYVSTTFYERLMLSPEEMRGRRVLSNPPGVTVVSILLHRAVAQFESLGGTLIRVFGLDQLDDAEQRIDFAAAMLLGIVFTAAWGLAVVLAYRLCRLWLPPTAAMCVSFACVINPATVNFTPGKDPAQLLTVLAILCCWMAAYQTGKRRWAALAGIAVAVGCTMGLIHIWILLIAASATMWHAVFARKNLGTWVTSCAVPASAGFAAAVIGLFAAVGWNLPLTIYRVAMRYGEIQLPVVTDPFHWTLVGLPMFLLFVGPFFWILLAALRRDIRNDAAALGGAILVCTSGVMVYTYFFANNSETPRLWIPFIPPLLLAMALRRSWFLTNSPGARRLHIVLIALQLTVTIAHWSLMDVRESEWRITTGRMWD